MRRVEYADITNRRKYLVRADGHSVLPHCYGVTCSESGDTVFAQDYCYKMELRTLQTMLCESIEKPTIFELAENATEGAPSSLASHSNVLLSLRAGARGDPDETPDVDSGAEIDSGEFETPSSKFLEMLRIEVSKYKASTRRAKKCELCPFREF